MRKIMKGSSRSRLAATARAMQAAILLISVLLAGAVIYLAYAFFAKPEVFTAIVRSNVVGPDVPIALDTITLAGLGLLAAVNLAIIVCGLSYVWRFAALIAAGQVFSLASSICLRRTGITALAGVVSEVISRLLANLLATMGNPAGQKMLVIGFGSDEAFLLLLAALLFAIGHAMMLAAEIEAENREFV
jgi:hypothetical protein